MLYIVLRNSPDGAKSFMSLAPPGLKFKLKGKKICLINNIGRIGP